MGCHLLQTAEPGKSNRKICYIGIMVGISFAIAPSPMSQATAVTTIPLPHPTPSLSRTKMIPYSMSDLPDKINAILRFLYSYPIEIKNDEAAIAVTKELRRVDEGSYQYIRNSLFPGSDAHPTGARYVLPPGFSEFLILTRQASITTSRDSACESLSRGSLTLCLPSLSAKFGTHSSGKVSYHPR